MTAEAAEKSTVLGARRRTIAAVAIVAAGILVVGGIAIGSLTRRSRTRIVTTPQSPVTPALPLGAVELPPGTPETILAANPDTGMVALLDSGTGVPVRVLATEQPAGEGERVLQGVALAPHRRTAYFALSGGCGDAVLYQVPADGSRPARRVGEGTSPATSPDGRKLAYVALGPETPGGPPPCPNVVVVRDLRTGKERRWRFPDTDEFERAFFRDAALTRLSWAPDSRRLAITHSYEGDSVSVLDTRTAGDLSETTEVVIPGGGGESSHPAWQASSGRLAVFNRAFQCCFEDNYQGPPRTLVVDLEARRTQDLLPVGLQPSWLDFDLTGDHLLYVDGGSLYRRGGLGEPALVAPGFTLADW